MTSKKLTRISVCLFLIGLVPTGCSRQVRYVSFELTDGGNPREIGYFPVIYQQDRFALARSFVKCADAAGYTAYQIDWTSPNAVAQPWGYRSFQEGEKIGFVFFAWPTGKAPDLDSARLLLLTRDEFNKEAEDSVIIVPPLKGLPEFDVDRLALRKKCTSGP